MKKKILSFVVATMMLASVFTVARAAEVPFTDLDKDAWYYDEVVAAYERGIMVGTSDTTFEPNSPVTREMFVTALSRVLDADLSRYNPGFLYGDVDANSGRYYLRPIMWAWEEDILVGISYPENDTKYFGLGMAVTREQIATFLNRVLVNNFLVLPQADKVIKCTDTPSNWAKSSVDVMLKSGIMYGSTNGSFMPKKSATRAEVAAILVRFVNSLQQATADFDFSADDAIMAIIDAYENKTYISERQYFTEDTELIQQLINYINEAPILKVEKTTDPSDRRPDNMTQLHFKKQVRKDSCDLIIHSDGKTVYYKDYLYSFEDGYLQPILDAVASTSL